MASIMNTIDHAPASPAADYAQGTAYVGGRYVPIGEASIPITDWGFLRSDATYDVVTVWDGAFFRLAEHLQRFRASCARFRLDPGLTDAQISGILARCVRLSGLRAAYVEMIVTRGQPPWGSRDPRQAVAGGHHHGPRGEFPGRGEFLLHHALHPLAALGGGAPEGHVPEAPAGDRHRGGLR